jgi:hypothetical protein
MVGHKIHEDSHTLRRTEIEFDEIGNVAIILQKVVIPQNVRQKKLNEVVAQSRTFVRDPVFT